RGPAPTPLVDALHARGQLRHELALHIPGHKVLAAALWRADATRFLVSGSTGGVLAALGDVAGLAAVAHAHGLPLLVDEAHGAHLGLHPSFPASALACGADVVVQSTHKTLGALTQAAVLHVRGGRVDLDRLDQALQ
ncbi:hypothetical protein APUTEX25_002980, partial [Auxenochlorella protothecoides]